MFIEKTYEKPSAPNGRQGKRYTITTCIIQGNVIKMYHKLVPSHPPIKMHEVIPEAFEPETVQALQA